MQMRVVDYIAGFLVKNKITDVFMITGGGAMYLNDALGHHPQLHCIYNHHEQACAIAAESYARINNRIAAVCVTTGPGGLNTITGVAGGYLDSIPMLVIFRSGAVRHHRPQHQFKYPCNGRSGV
jgi:acetolactate synthase I/II/III large subunit